MAAVINTNLASLNAQRNLSMSQSSLNTSIQRLSSGLRVNSAKDDAAGLAIAERMNAQVRGMNVAIRNANDGISLSQTAEGGLSSVGDMMQRMRELAVQAASDSNAAGDRTNLNQEYQQLASEITRQLNATTFNGVAILGAGAAALDFQVGANNSANDRITVTTTNMVADASVVAVTSGVGNDLTTKANAQTAMANLDTAITTINSERAKLGAAQNRLLSTVSNLQVNVENQSAARGRIMDADFAAETANMTRGQILQQAGTAMLAQANSLPNTVLQLLRG